MVDVGAGKAPDPMDVPITISGTLLPEEIAVEVRTDRRASAEVSGKLICGSRTLVPQPMFCGLYVGDQSSAAYVFRSNDQHTSMTTCAFCTLGGAARTISPHRGRVGGDKYSL